MLLENNNYSKTALLNKTVLITGGGGGIGFEASRAFSYMGAKVIIAEIDVDRGTTAQTQINNEFGNDNVDFYQIDISDEKHVDRLYDYIISKYSHLDVLINNAAVVPMGAIDKVSVSQWDLSYAVNLRAPVLLIQRFLPSMKDTGGIIVFNPSANVAPYMSAYEIFKTAQVELCNTLSDENTESDIIVYSVAPGFVKTDTAMRAVEIVASSMGITTDDFYESQSDYIVDAEIAGVGYAVSVVNARKYHGKVTMSYQVLVDSGLIVNDVDSAGSTSNQADFEKLSLLFTSIIDVFNDQYQNWQKKNLFQKKFILSDFKKQMGQSADNFKAELETLQNQIQNHQWDSFFNSKEMFIKLQRFYEHQIELLKGYEKDPEQLASDTGLLNSWIDTLQEIINMLLNSK